MNKEIIYSNMCNMIENGYFLEKYKELTSDIVLEENDGNKKIMEQLENISAQIFNSILIGCQLFDDEKRIVKFIDAFCRGFSSFELEIFLSQFNITVEEACERLKHGFGVHFTTTGICDEIMKSGVLKGYGTNQMFTEEEDKTITEATNIQRNRDPKSNETMRYLFRGFGTGVSSYSSITNGFWMYHTPESLSFLFGDISCKDKQKSMSYVASCITKLDDEKRIETFNTMSNIWDRLVGNDQEVGCVLIDRDAFEYEVDYYYDTEPPTIVERRPYSHGLSAIDDNDNKITNDISIENLKFLKIPTVIQLEKLKNSTKQY